MGNYVLSYPIHTLDHRELIPAHSEITDEHLEEFVSRARRRPSSAVALMSHGSVKKDILRSFDRESYRHIFAQEVRRREVLELMERVEVAPVVLQVLDYFKRYDPYTYRHKLTVFALSAILAKELVEDADDMLMDAAAGPSHDFGKICVPLRVLRKKEPLTRGERQLLEHHAVAGYILLSYHLGDVHNFSARVARDHHERRDGSGYPLGISQEDRLVEIVAVSDIYDALVSPRPYRATPFDNRTALEEITDMAHQGKVSWDVLQSLVALNRQDKPYYAECAVSIVKRGSPPPGNVYGVTVPEEGPEAG